MAEVPVLVDQHGRPLQRASAKLLAAPVATASLTGIRQAWNAQQITSGLTPQRLASIMRRAAEGDHLDFVTLAEEMEERDWHYAGALGQRKLAVLGLDRLVEAAPNDPQGEEIAQAVREDIVDDEAFEDLLTGALDAMGKGWAAVEIAWALDGARWKPAASYDAMAYEWRDPRWFRWDRETGRELRLIDEADPAFGVPLPANRFCVHRPQLKMGLPVRGGLARLAAWGFLFKFYAVKDWAAFCETYGQPLRVGKYGAAATSADIDVLYQAVAMIGTDCAAVIPEAMTIEFVNALQGSSSSGASIYQAFAEFMDRQVSKAVLGQTGTTDMQKGGGFAQAKVLDGVRVDLRDSDALQLARTVRRDVIAPYVRFNFGMDAAIPGFALDTTPPADLEKLVAGITPLIDRGLKVKASQLREKFDLDAPEPEDEVLTPAAKGAAGLALPAPDARAANRVGRATPAAAGRADADEVDALQAALDEGWSPVMDAALEPIFHLAARASSFEEFRRELDASAAAMDMTPLARSLALALFKARGLGDAADAP